MLSKNNLLSWPWKLGVINHFAIIMSSFLPQTILYRALYTRQVIFSRTWSIHFFLICFSHLANLLLINSKVGIYIFSAAENITLRLLLIHFKLSFQFIQVRSWVLKKYLNEKPSLPCLSLL